MAKGMKAAVAAAVLGVGLIGAVQTAAAQVFIDARRSGGAPSPEVNTVLGFLIVGGTVAFLKRRRKGSEVEEAAEA